MTSPTKSPKPKLFSLQARRFLAFLEGLYCSLAQFNLIYLFVSRHEVSRHKLTGEQTQIDWQLMELQSVMKIVAQCVISNYDVLVHRL